MTFSIPIPAFNPAELEARAAQRRLDQRAALSAAGRFNAISLIAWLPRVEAAGVPVIPAEVVFSLPQKVWLNFDQPDESHGPVWQGLTEAVSHTPESHMLRWDFCASLSLKGAMGRAQHPADVMRELSADDPRAFDILYEYPGDFVPVLRRPWVQAQYSQGYPLEFRAFVKDDEVIGIASYYPQRPLASSAEIDGYVDSVFAYSRSVVAHLRQAGEYPWLMGFERQFKEGTVNATLDFLVSTKGEVLFIEAGPPFGAGAHPCAFLGRDEIAGVALALPDDVELY